MMGANPDLCLVDEVQAEIIEEAAKFINALQARGLTILQACLLIDEMTLIHQLRKPEGATVTVTCDNPDFTGPENAVEVCDDWTDWKDRRFTGGSLLECLSAAVVAQGGR